MANIETVNREQARTAAIYTAHTSIVWSKTVMSLSSNIEPSQQQFSEINTGRMQKSGFIRLLACSLLNP